MAEDSGESSDKIEIFKVQCIQIEAEPQTASTEQPSLRLPGVDGMVINIHVPKSWCRVNTLSFCVLFLKFEV